MSSNLTKEQLLSAERLSQPKTGNIFSPDYKVAECHGCGRVLGVDLLRRVKRQLYCYFCFQGLEHKVANLEARKEERNRRVKYIQDHPELSLRRLGILLGISHEMVRQIRKRERGSRSVQNH